MAQATQIDVRPSSDVIAWLRERIAQTCISRRETERIISPSGKEQNWLIDLRGLFVKADALEALAATAGNQAFTFIGASAFSGTPGEIRYYQSGGNTYIEMQTGTSVDVEGVIRLDGTLTPQATWFIL